MVVDTRPGFYRKFGTLPDFTLQGNNSATAFINPNYGSDDGWTTLATDTNVINTEV